MGNSVSFRRHEYTPASAPTSARAVRKSSLPNEIILASIRNESVITALSTGPGTTLVVGLLTAPLSPRSLLRTQGIHQTTRSPRNSVPCLFVQTLPSGILLVATNPPRNSRPELIRVRPARA